MNEKSKTLKVEPIPPKPEPTDEDWWRVAQELEKFGYTTTPPKRMTKEEFEAIKRGEDER